MLALALGYLKSALATASYFRSPLHDAEFAGLAVLMLVLRYFLGGLGGWIIRTALYIGLFVAIVSWDQFRILIPDSPTPAAGNAIVHFLHDLSAGRHPSYVIAAIMMIALWLPVTVLGGLLRAAFGRETVPVVEYSPAAATAEGGNGQPFDVRRPDQEKKQIMTVMMTDIAGYSARMEKDEAATYALLKEHNVIMRRNITTHRGKEIKTIGDAFMVVFQNPIDALRCGIAMQKDLHTFNKPRPAHDQLKVRIGIFRGEVIATGKDVFGEGVNIAARMESITEPGGVSISADIYEETKGKVEAGFLDIGQPKMKNIANPPKVYRVQINFG